MGIEVDVNDNGTIDIEYGGTNASTPAGARTNLGLGTAAELDAGNAEGEVIIVLADQKLPVLDGSNLTNVQPVGGGVTSVNTETGAVVLNADDIGDGTNYAILTKVEQANVANNTLVISRIEDVEKAVEDAEASAAAALVSENNASDSEDAAALSETAASDSEDAAFSSEGNASDSEDAAAVSAAAALASEIAANDSEIAAGLSEVASALSETNADDSETAAALSETNASDSETAALVSENKAHDWAEEDEDISVETGEYSAHHWATKAAALVTHPPLSCGMEAEPTYTDHGDGSITVDGGTVHLNTLADFTGDIIAYTVPQDTFTLDDNDTTYITADYNSGTPIYVATTDVAGINESTVIPVFTINRNGTILSIMSWDGLGVGLSNKIHARLVKTDRIVRQSGLSLFEDTGRIVEITSGVAWVGAAANTINAFASDVNSLRLFSHSSGVWSSSIVTQYNNTQYDDGTDIQTLGTAKYAVNWIFRNVSEDCCAGIVLGGAEYNLAQALDSALPSSLPENIVAQGILVGRIIVAKDASTAAEIQSAFTTTFSGGVAIQSHNDLTNLQGGATDDYYHLTGDGATVVDEVDLQRHVVSEMQFKMQAAANRDKFGGSGFVEWGKYYAGSLTYQPMNEGLWTDISTANILISGNTTAGTADSASISKTNLPLLNVNGAAIQLGGTHHTEDQLTISFPDAPNDYLLPERQDLVFLESWHEKIADKDIVYPYGNVQSLLVTDPATGLTTVNGSFTGYDTYSLFGNWQDASDLIGRGLVWSTLSDANKKKFVSDPENNIYLAEDGELVQVRYRIRVVEGLGANWLNTNETNGDANYLYYSITEFIKPKGNTVSITADIADYNANATGSFATATQAAVSLLFPNGDIGHFAASDTTAVALDEDIAYKGLCFALPIALVSRRNQGAFHPVFNPNGTADFYQDGATNIPREWYRDAVVTIASTFDCFDKITTSSYDGSITAGALRRPDEKAYDAIYESDVLDLRNSAHKQDLTRTLEREFNKLVAGETRGWENSKFSVTWCHDKTVTASSSAVVKIAVSDLTGFVGYPDPITDGYAFIAIRMTDGQKFFGTHIQEEGGQIWFTIDEIVDAGSNWTIIIYRKDSFKIPTKTLLQCDIIGDPANYPQEWIDNGVMGTPLLVGEEGEDLIPDGGDITWKMSRKVKEKLLVLTSEDNGVTWVNALNITWDDIEGSSNSVTWLAPASAGAADKITLVFYLTEASPFEVADNAEVLKLGDVWAGNRADSRLGLVVSHLINKVAVGASDGYKFYKLGSYAIPYTRELSTDGDLRLTHDLIDFDDDNNPAVKLVSYLTRENGKLFLQTLFKEMKYDTDWGDDNKFDVVDEVSTTTDDNGNTILIGQKRLELPYFIGDGE